MTNNLDNYECIGNTIIQSKTEIAKSDYPGYIQIPDIQGATNVLMQVYINPDDLPEGITANDLSHKAIISITEVGNIGTILGEASLGMKLLNFGTYQINTPNNIRNSKILALVENVNVYCVFTYFKNIATL